MDRIDKEDVHNNSKDSLDSELDCNEELAAVTEEAMMDRLSTVERLLQQQADDILLLRSALSDAIRRLTNVEQTPSQTRSQTPLQTRSQTPSQTHNQVSQQVPHHYQPTPTRTAKRQEGKLSRRTFSSDGIHRMTPSPSPSSGRLTPAKLTKKWPSFSPGDHAPMNGVGGGGLSNSRLSDSLGSLSTHFSTGRTSTPKRGLREAIYNAEERQLRIYLKGRPVNMAVPSYIQDINITKSIAPPVEKLKLEWVYGYRGKDSRNNLFILPTGELIYFIAAVVVLYNVDEQIQRHYTGHNDDIKSLSIHPDKITVATGQVAGHDKREEKPIFSLLNKRRSDNDLIEPRDNWPHIRIWNSLSLQTLHVIGLGHFDRAISCIAFSKTDGGQHLCAVDEANEHVMSVWQWQRESKVIEVKSSTDTVLACEFHPSEKNTIITCGKGHINFWIWDRTGITKRQGIYEKYDKPRFVNCIAFASNGDVMSGDSNGNIVIWGRGTNKIVHVLPNVHEGTVFTICTSNDGVFLSGGKDRCVIKWDVNYRKLASTKIDEVHGSIRTFGRGPGSQIVIGTTRNNILIGSFEDKWIPIVCGHVEELWGLATHPTLHQFVTAGVDKNMVLWDALEHSVVWFKSLPESAHSVAFHPNGKIVIVGLCNGRWLALELSSQQIVSSHTDGNEQVECLSFSSDGSSLAIGSRDNMIYVYNVTEDGQKYSRIGRCMGHSSYITHVDWSIDGQVLQSNSGDYEILFWNRNNCKQVATASQLRDIDWATNNCTLGFNVCGIWPDGADGTDINACCRAPRAHNLLASGDDFGNVNLFKYPCYQPRANCHTFVGHSSHVTNVQFVNDDSKLLSTGGRDTSILQWNVSI